MPHVNDEFLINNSTISTLVCVSPQIQFRALGELCSEDCTALAAEQEPAWAWSTLFYVFMMGLGCIQELK